MKEPGKTKEVKDYFLTPGVGKAGSKKIEEEEKQGE